MRKHVFLALAIIVILPSCNDIPRNEQPSAVHVDIPGCRAVWDPAFPPTADLAPGSVEAQDRQKAEANRLGMPVEIVNTVGMRFRFIPAGVFMMGSPMDETGRSMNETRHRVSLTLPFYMGVTEVTQGQYSAVMGENPSWFKGKRRPLDIRFPEHLPVDDVSWDDCQVFARRLCEQEGVPEGTYRLPTEAEWEYACRAGTTTAFYSGDCTSSGGIDPAMDRIGWYMHNSEDHPYPVGLKAANAWGLHDTSGNMSEWCADSCVGAGDAITDTYWEDIEDPLCGRGTWRVHRGGVWHSWPKGCRSARRNSRPPNSRVNVVGLRLVREVGVRPLGSVSLGAGGRRPQDDTESIDIPFIDLKVNDSDGPIVEVQSGDPLNVTWTSNRVASCLGMGMRHGLERLPVSGTRTIIAPTVARATGIGYTIVATTEDGLEMVDDIQINISPSEAAEPTVVIISPNGGETFIQGGNNEILWEGGEAHVSLSLLDGDGNNTGGFIMNSLPSSGRYIWDAITVYGSLDNGVGGHPRSIAPGVYRIRVSDAIAASDMSDASFTIIADDN